MSDAPTSPGDSSDGLVELGPENDAALVRLRRAIELDPGFQLLLVEIDEGPVRREIIRRILGWGGFADIPTFELVRTRNRQNVQDPIGDLGHRPGGVVLVGLDEARGSASERRRIVRRAFASLNWDRDRLPDLVHGPLLIVVGAEGFKHLFVDAPDLMTWRRHTARFVGAPRTDLLALEPRPWRADLERRRTTLELARTTESIAGRLDAFDLALLLASTCRLLGDLDSAGAFASQAETLAARDPRLRARAQIVEAQIAIDASDLETARTNLRGATRELDQRPDGTTPNDRDIAMLALTNGRLHLADGVLREAANALHWAARMAERLDGVMTVEAYARGAMVAAARGENEDAARLFDLADRAAESADHDWLRAFALRARAWAAPPSEAIEVLERAMALVPAGNSPERAEIAVDAATAAIETADFQLAETWLERVAWAASESRLPDLLRARHLMLRGAIATYHRDHAKAIEVYETALHLLEGLRGQGRRVEAVRILVGEAALQSGRYEVARARFAEVRAMAEARGFQENVILGRFGVGRARRALGLLDPETLADLTGAADGFAARREQTREALARIELGRACAAMGDRARAAAELRRAEVLLALTGHESARAEAAELRSAVERTV